MSELGDVAREAALSAGALLLERFGATARGVTSKSTLTDLVSDADREAEALIERTLRERRPEDAIVGEEGAKASGTSGLRWVVDPLDGTINFLFAIPHWCVSLACVDERGARVGVVHDPCKRELFVAERGAGAWLGERRLAVTTQADLAQALVATGFAYDSILRERQADAARRVLPRVRDLRRFGSAALDLAWVAAGRLDGYYESGVMDWDIAAGALLVAEAGGAVSELDHVGPDRRRGFLASNGRIHAALGELLD